MLSATILDQVATSNLVHLTNRAKSVVLLLLLDVSVGEVLD